MLIHNEVCVSETSRGHCDSPSTTTVKYSRRQLATWDSAVLATDIQSWPLTS